MQGTIYPTYEEAETAARRAVSDTGTAQVVWRRIAKNPEYCVLGECVDPLACGWRPAGKIHPADTP